MKRKTTAVHLFTSLILLAMPFLFAFDTPEEKYSLTWCDKAPGTLAKADLQKMLINQCLDVSAINSHNYRCSIITFTMAIKPAMGSHTYFMEQYGNTINNNTQKLLGSVTSGDKIVIGNINLQCGQSKNISQNSYTYTISK